VEGKRRKEEEREERKRRNFTDKPFLPVRIAERMPCILDTAP